MALQDEAQAIAATLPATTASGATPNWLTIITNLLPFLTTCLPFLAAPGQTPRDYVTSHFDDQSQTFDDSLISAARPHARRAARKSGERGLSRDDLDAMSVATFTHVMNMDDPTVAACMAEASANQ